MSVTEDSDYGDVECKQEIPDSGTVKCKIFSSGSQCGMADTEPQSHTDAQTGNY